MTNGLLIGILIGILIAIVIIILAIPSILAALFPKLSEQVVRSAFQSVQLEDPVYARAYNCFLRLNNLQG